MQGINLSSVMSESFTENVPSGALILFDGTVPTNLGELAFDPTVIQEVFAEPNFVGLKRVGPQTASYSPGLVTVPFNEHAGVYGATVGVTDFVIPVKHAWSSEFASLDLLSWDWSNFFHYSAFREQSEWLYLNCGTGEGAYIPIDLPDLDDGSGGSISLTGFGFVQRNVTYTRTYQGSSGSDTTRATSVSLDYFDETLNAGAGDWVQHQTFDTDVLQTGILNLTTPLNLSGISQLRLTCRGGADARAEATDIVGNPHWSVSSVSLFTNQQPYVAATEADIRTPTWGIFIPLPDFSSYAASITGTFSYRSLDYPAPMLLFDVGASGSGSTVELVDPNMTYLGVAKPSKLNINFQGFGS